MNRLSHNQGFTLLYAILVVGVLMSIVFAIINISYKQVSLSGVARDSQIAFYMADTGAECAKYWDMRGFFATSTPARQITCNGQTFFVGGAYGVENTLVNGENNTRVKGSGELEACPDDEESDCALTTFTLAYEVGSTNSAQVTIKLYKKLEDGQTTLEAAGHNTDEQNSPRRVERAVKLVYTPEGSGFCGGDILVLMDKSGSIEQSDMVNLGTAVKSFITKLLDDNESSARVGLIAFGTKPLMSNSMGLTDFSSRQTLLDSVDSIVEAHSGTNEGTNLSGALYLANTEFNGTTNTNQNDNINQTGPLQNPRRDRLEVPNYIFVFTDGSPNSRIIESTGEYGSSLGGANACTNSLTQWCAGSKPVLDQTSEAADYVKQNSTAAVYTIAIDFADVESECDHSYQNCSEYLRTKVVGGPTDLGAGNSTPRTGYYYTVSNFDTALQELVDNLTGICS